MNTTDSHGNKIGGGEILDYIFGNNVEYGGNMDDSLIAQFKFVPIVRIIIIVGIMFLMCYIILRLLNMRSPFKGRGVKAELDHMDAVKKKDAAVIRANNWMNWITNFIEKTPLAMNKTTVEYWQYNLKRANIRIPGGYRVMKAVEFHAIIQFCTLCCCCVALVCAVFANAILGVSMIIASVIFSSFVPMAYVRGVVREKDGEIKENFVNLYLMVHYSLLARANTDLASLMKSYLKTTDSKEMERFVDTCVHYLETYEEDTAATYISKEYREIQEVGKMMRLIRQVNSGGNIEQELIGFRQELITTQKYEMTKAMEKLVSRARMSFNLLMPVLIQAILSAMSIYLSDMNLTGMFGI